MSKSWRKNESLLERFIKYVSMNNTTGCWDWTGNICFYGYGRINYKMKSYRANRAAFILFKQTDPGKLLVCHKCDNTKCVNPDHLFLGTQKDNMKDCKAKKRTAYGHKNGSSKLKENDVLIIKDLAKKNLTHLEISKRFGVSRANIGLILNNKRWKHLNKEV